MAILLLDRSFESGVAILPNRYKLKNDAAVVSSNFIKTSAIFAANAEKLAAVAKANAEKMAAVLNANVEKEKDRAISPLEEGSSLYLEVHMIARLESMRQHA